MSTMRERKMPKLKKDSKYITIELNLQEAATLQEFCKKYNRTQTDVVREMIRGLESKV